MLGSTRLQLESAVLNSYVFKNLSLEQFWCGARCGAAVRAVPGLERVVYGWCRMWCHMGVHVVSHGCHMVYIQKGAIQPKTLGQIGLIKTERCTQLTVVPHGCHMGCHMVVSHVVSFLATSFKL